MCLGRGAAANVLLGSCRGSSTAGFSRLPKIFFTVLYPDSLFPDWTDGPREHQACPHTSHTPGRTATGSNSGSPHFTFLVCTGTPDCWASTIWPFPMYIATW